MITRTFKLCLNAGTGSAPYINVNQYDRGEVWQFELYNEDGTRYTPSTGAIIGLKADGHAIMNNGTVDSDGRVVITETEQMTAAAGRSVFELSIDSNTHGTANFIVKAERKPTDDAEFSDSDLSLIQQAVDSATEIEDILDGQDVPTVITPIISDWLDENITNPSNPPIDTSLTVAGAAADAKVTGDEITDLKSAFNFTEHKSENLLNPSEIEEGCYYWTNGRNASASYNATPYIPVEEGQTIYLQTGYESAVSRSNKTMRFVTGYDSNKTVINSACVSNADSYTVPQGVSFIIASVAYNNLNASQNPTLLVSETGTVLDYIPWFEPYTTKKLKDECDSEQTDQNTSDIESLTTSVEQNTQDIADLKAESVGSKKPLTFTASADTLAANTNLIVCNYSDNKKNEYIELTANFETFGSLTIAHGKEYYGGGYIVITPTKIQTYSYNGTLYEEFEHGLTLTDFINVICYTKNDSSNRSRISIMTAGGDYIAETTRFYSTRASVLCNADFAMTNVQMRYTINDAKEDVWIFGDSYVSLGDPNRWASRMVTDGHKHALICGFGGARSADVILPFRQYLAITKPKYLVWCLGMNDGDSNSAVNADWETYVNEVITTCESEGVTPILATIPNVPNVNNTFKNAYVKASGKRFVDFAKAVNAESTGATWYIGMLSSDNTHPTTLGAKALMRQFLLDVPEVLAAEE